MPRPKSLIREITDLRLAATRLYVAGRWERANTPDRKADEKLWEALRDALGLPPGTANHIPQ